MLEIIEESLDQQETESKDGKSSNEDQDHQEKTKDVVTIKKCKLKRQRFEASAAQKSQVGGGRLFRTS